MAHFKRESMSDVGHYGAAGAVPKTELDFQRERRTVFAQWKFMFLLAPGRSTAFWIRATASNWRSSPGSGSSEANLKHGGIKVCSQESGPRRLRPMKNPGGMAAGASAARRPSSGRRGLKTYGSSCASWINPNRSGCFQSNPPTGSGFPDLNRQCPGIPSY